MPTLTTIGEYDTLEASLRLAAAGPPAPRTEAPRAAQLKARIIKRAFDVVVGSAAGLLAIPLGIAIAVAIKLQSTGPVFYAHPRVGRGGQTIYIWKFRTMVADADAVLTDYLQAHPELATEWHEQRKLRRDPRVTRIGQVLREWSLDELPQLWNVIRGDMSMVGPRPVVREELARYGTASSMYLAVKPGLTGMWQTSGRNDVTYSYRVCIDSAYIQSWSVAEDALILLKTLPAVVRRVGAY